MTTPVVLDVTVSELAHVTGAGHVRVVVEPLYGTPAVALALDAGWASVEVAEEIAGTSPIPLVSFEQAPAGELSSARCRVRSSDLADVLNATNSSEATTLLGSPTFARPLGARLAQSLERAVFDRVTFVVASSTHTESDQSGSSGERAAADGWWAAGVLIRVLLDEIDTREVRLTDMAGIAVNLATGSEHAEGHLGAGLRWRRHLARGGAADDLRRALAVDSVSVVPEIDIEDGRKIARRWDSPVSIGT
ncbi:MAG: hypothetical protein JWN41_1593 [Thermoleophilia bacterium]|nr:hypothetical protein [Thermoleophilia bacterium]